MADCSVVCLRSTRHHHSCWNGRKDNGRRTIIVVTALGVVVFKPCNGCDCHKKIKKLLTFSTFWPITKRFFQLLLLLLKIKQTTRCHCCWCWIRVLCWWIRIVGTKSKNAMAALTSTEQKKGILCSVKSQQS